MSHRRGARRRAAATRRDQPPPPPPSADGQRSGSREERRAADGGGVDFFSAIGDSLARGFGLRPRREPRDREARRGERRRPFDEERPAADPPPRAIIEDGTELLGQLAGGVGDLGYVAASRLGLAEPPPWPEGRRRKGAPKPQRGRSREETPERAAAVQAQVVQSLTVRLQEALAEGIETKEQLKSMEAKVHQLTEAQAAQAQLLPARASVEQEVQTLRSQLDRVFKEKAALEAERASLEAERGELSTQLAASLAEQRKLSAEAKRASTAAQAAAAAEEGARRKASAEAAHATAATAAVAEAEEDVRKLHADLESLRAERTALRRERDEGGRQLEEALTAQPLGPEAEQLRAAAERATVERNIAVAQLEKMRAEREEDVKRFDEHLASFQARVEEAQAEVTRLFLSGGPRGPSTTSGWPAMAPWWKSWQQRPAPTKVSKKTKRARRRG